MIVPINPFRDAPTRTGSALQERERERERRGKRGVWVRLVERCGVVATAKVLVGIQ